MLTKLRKRIATLMLALMLVMLAVPTSVFAGTGDKGIDAQKGLNTLIKAVSDDSLKDGDYKGASWDYTKRHYKLDDGGYLLYEELAQNNSESPINANNLGLLTTGAKNEFMTDYYNAGQRIINSEKKNNYPHGITAEVGNNWLKLVQDTEGVGSQLITTLMSQTKPDFVTANRIYAPFSGTVGTIMGLIAVMLMGGLALTMVLDLAYIAVPAVQLMFDGGEGGQGGGGKKSLISKEARDAVQGAEGGNGGNGQGGITKLAVTIYLKNRILMLIVLGVCLLYLVSGNIFSLVGMLLDLLRGFLGF